MDRRALLLMVFLGLQALFPLHYYLGDDPFDERFAWRMFSPVRMLRCEMDIRVNGVSQSLSSDFHSAWITLVTRGRMDVTEAVGERVCLLNGGREVVLRYRCRHVDGQWDVIRDGTEELCP